jgi:hypothetical protein
MDNHLECNQDGVKIMHDEHSIFLKKILISIIKNKIIDKIKNLNATINFYILVYID